MSNVPKNTLPRGLRNRNPLNIRKSESQTWKGQSPAQSDPDFVVFQTMAYGYRAAFRLMRTYQRKYHICTVEGVVNRFAPSAENDTDAYVRFVCEKTGFTPDDTVDLTRHDTAVPIVRALSWMENGTEPDTRQIEEGWRLYAGG